MMADEVQPAPALLSMRQYAKLRGVSPEAVSKAVRQGRISTTQDADGARKIDPAAADREWNLNSDPSKYRGEPEDEDGEDPRPNPGMGGAVRQMNYNEARAAREEWKANLAKLDYEERLGRLVEVEAVKAQWESVASTVRAKVLGIPSKARQRIPDFTADQYAVLEALVREALEELSDD